MTERPTPSPSSSSASPHHEHAFITGATGFLGGALARRLLAEGTPVRVLARSAERAAPLAALGADIVVGSLHDTALLADAVHGCTHVYHSAAQLNGPYAEQYHANAEGTRTLMTACGQAHTREPGVLRRIVHVSTIAVYGYANRRPLNESVPAAPGADPYATSKAHAERAAFAAAEAYSLPLTVIRPGGIFGAGAGLWTRVMFMLATARATPWPGDGHGRAPFIHVDDVVDQMIVQAHHPGAVGGVFNSALDPAPTFRDILTAYAALAGRAPCWLFVPPAALSILGGLAMLAAPRESMARDLPDLVGYAQRRHGYPMDKARALLGWRPALSLEAGVARCAPWLRSEGLLR